MEINLADMIEKTKDDSKAFDGIYNLYYKRIFNYLLRKTQNFETAKDLTADTFIKVISAIIKFKYRDDEGFTAWIYKIAGNCFNMYYRQQKRYKFCLPEELETFYQQTIPISEVTQIEDEIASNQDFQNLTQALIKMKDKDRNLIELRYWEELSYEQISQITGIRVGTLKVQLHRALEILKNLIL